MPTYQYQCTGCKLQFELRQSFSEKPIATCPACHKVARRLFSPVPIIFKGPGFYVTDSRTDKGGSEPSAKKVKEEKKQGGES